MSIQTQDGIVKENPLSSLFVFFITASALLFVIGGLCVGSSAADRAVSPSEQSVDARMEVTVDGESPDTLKTGDEIMVDASLSDSASGIQSYSWTLSVAGSSPYVREKSGRVVSFVVRGPLPSVNSGEDQARRRPLSDIYNGNPPSLDDFDATITLRVTSEQGETDTTTRNYEVQAAEPFDESDIIANDTTGLPEVNSGYPHGMWETYSPSYRIFHSNLRNWRGLSDFHEIPYVSASREGFGLGEVDEEVPGSAHVLPPFLPTYPLTVPAVRQSSSFGGGGIAFEPLGEVEADPFSLSTVTDSAQGVLYPGDPVATYNRTLWSNETEVDSLSAFLPSEGPPQRTLGEVQQKRQEILEQMTASRKRSYLPHYYDNSIAGGISDTKTNGVIRQAIATPLVSRGAFELSFDPPGEGDYPLLTGNSPTFDLHTDYRIDPSHLPQDNCNIVSRANGTNSPTKIYCEIYEIGNVTGGGSAKIPGFPNLDQSWTNVPLDSQSQGSSYSPDLSGVDGIQKVNYVINRSVNITQYTFNFSLSEYVLGIGVQDGGEVVVNRENATETVVESTDNPGEFYEYNKTIFSGTEVSVFADPHSGKVFDGWEVYSNGSSEEWNTQSREFILTNDTELVATFTNRTGNGSNSSSGSGGGTQGASSQVFSATQSPGENTQTSPSNNSSTSGERLLSYQPDRGEQWELEEINHTMNYANDSVSLSNSFDIANVQNNVENTEITQLKIERETGAGGTINDVLLKIDRPEIGESSIDPDEYSGLTPQQLVQQAFLANLALTVDLPTRELDDDGNLQCCETYTLGVVDFPWAFTTVQQQSGATMTNTSSTATNRIDWRNALPDPESGQNTRPGNGRPIVGGPNSPSVNTDPFGGPLGREQLDSGEFNQTIPELPVDASGLFDRFNSYPVVPPQTSNLWGVTIPHPLRHVMFADQDSPEFSPVEQPPGVYFAVTDSFNVSAFLREHNAQSLDEVNPEDIREAENVTRVNGTDYFDPAPITYGGHEGVPVAVDNSTVPLNTTAYFAPNTTSLEAAVPSFATRILIKNTIGEVSTVQTIFGESASAQLTTHTIPSKTPNLSFEHRDGGVILTATYEARNGTTQPFANRRFFISGAQESSVVTNASGKAIIPDAGMQVQVEFAGDPQTRPCHDFESYSNCIFFTQTTAETTSFGGGQISGIVWRLIKRALLAFPVFFIYLLWTNRKFFQEEEL
jgi:hypothetical protein